jgi:hypothetical protein
MNPNLLLLPVAIHAIATMLIFIPMSRARVKSVMEGKVKASVYRYNTEEPEESRRFSNAIRNQNETGVLFYAACLVAYVSDALSWWTVGLAFAFLIVKLAHVSIQVTSNRLRTRRPVFMIALSILVLLWLVVLVHLVGTL